MTNPTARSRGLRPRVTERAFDVKGDAEFCRGDSVEGRRAFHAEGGAVLDPRYVSAQSPPHSFYVPSDRRTPTDYRLLPDDEQARNGSRART